MKNLLSILVLVFAVTGCTIGGGAAKSVRTIERYNDAGKLVYRETQFDKNSMAMKGAFVKQEATGLKYSRTNFLGSSQTTALGNISMDVNTNAIAVTGEAAGQIIGAALKQMAK